MLGLGFELAGTIGLRFGGNAAFHGLTHSSEPPAGVFLSRGHNFVGIELFTKHRRREIAYLTMRTLACIILLLKRKVKQTGELRPPAFMQLDN
jgi:hypothetical protein